MAADPRTRLTDVVAEGTTSLISGSLVDETGAALGSAQLSTFIMTLYCLDAAQTVINARTDINILNAGPGTISVGGAWTITLTPADNDMIGTGTQEWHRLLLKWTYAAGVKAGAHEVEFMVRNVDKVT